MVYSQGASDFVKIISNIEWSKLYSFAFLNNFLLKTIFALNRKWNGSSIFNCEGSIDLISIYQIEILPAKVQIKEQMHFKGLLS